MGHEPDFILYGHDFGQMMDKIKKDGHLVSKDPHTQGQVRVSVNSSITGEEIPYEKADTEYYDMVIQDALEKLPGSTLQYDAIRSMANSTEGSLKK